MNLNKPTNLSYKLRDGFSVVEVLLAGALFALLVAVVLGAVAYGRESSVLSGARARAVFLAEEGLEAARNIRDNSFSSLVATNHGLTISSNEWSFSGTSDTTGAFTRVVSISTVDSTRKDLTSTVTWQQNPQRTGFVSLVTRLTNWLQSVGGWNNPFQEASLNFSGTEDGRKIQTDGTYVYIVRADGSPDFAIVNISIPASPSLTSSLSLSGIPTNIFVFGNYVYIASENDTQELQIIDITNKSAPVQVGSFNASGTADGRGIYVVGSTAYLTRASSSADELIIINVSIPSSPILIGSLDLADDGNEIYVSGNHAYIASARNNQELQVVDVTTPALPSLVGSYNISGNQDALTVAGSGNTVFLGSSANLYIFNISTPTSPSLLGSYSTAGTTKDIALNLGNSNTLIFVANANSNQEFEVIDIATPSSPVGVGGLNLTTLNGITYDSVLDRAFAVGENNSAELLILAPQ